MTSQLQVTLTPRRPHLGMLCSYRMQKCCTMMARYKWNSASALTFSPLNQGGYSHVIAFSKFEREPMERLGRMRVRRV
jgi:hypothetical protein